MQYMQASLSYKHHLKTENPGVGLDAGGRQRCLATVLPENIASVFSQPVLSILHRPRHGRCDIVIYHYISDKACS